MLPTLEPAELPVDAIEVGRIADAWGIKGWFKVLPHSAQPEALFSSKRWLLQPPGAAGGSAFRLAIREAKEHSDCIVASSEDVPDRNAAEALRGARVFVPRSSFPTAGDDEYYWVDLIGAEVINREGQSLGRVTALIDTGAHSVLCVRRSDAAPDTSDVQAERLIPFVAAYIDSVDTAARRIGVDWGLDY
jgi:16S rRNA processing protein RimM